MGQPEMLLHETVQVESLAADSHLGFGCAEFAAAETIRPPSCAARTSYLPTDFTTLPFLNVQPDTRMGRGVEHQPLAKVNTGHTVPV
jgi:hypothetical protein